MADFVTLDEFDRPSHGHDVGVGRQHDQAAGAVPKGAAILGIRDRAEFANVFEAFGGSSD